MSRFVLLTALCSLLWACKTETKNAPPPIDPPIALGPLPTQAQLDWHDMQYYMFVHFNMNTFTNKEWGYGDESPETFNPSELDTRQWARIAKEAGMKGIILTAKHHDGFCLWPSAYTDHSVKNSSWNEGKGDVVKELAEACKEYGLKMGLYLSPWDRNHAQYGEQEYLEYFHNQIRELLSNYGEVFEFWFDGANGGDGYYGGANETRKVDRKAYYKWSETFALVHELQPNALIFSDGGPDIRWVGNEKGFANEENWSLLRKEEVYPGYPDYKELTTGHYDGTDWVPAEVDVSIRPGWYYHPEQDTMLKSVDQLMDIYYKSIGRNANLLLNVPADTRGKIAAVDSARLMEFAAAIEKDFPQDIAFGKRVTTYSTYESHPDFMGSQANDGDYNTYWATDKNSNSNYAVLELGTPKYFNRILLQEYVPLGQRVDSFYVAARIGGEWDMLDWGCSIGYKRIIKLDQPAYTHRLILDLVSAKGPPIIANWEVYMAPEE
ncbi:MAG: alpha-L-fucosidase [Bacteroidota bacterium]